MNAEVEQTETEFQQKLKTQGKLSASDLQRMLDIHAQQMHEYERTFVAASCRLRNFERKNGLNFMLNLLEWLLLLALVNLMHIRFSDFVCCMLIF